MVLDSEGGILLFLFLIVIVLGLISLYFVFCILYLLAEGSPGLGGALRREADSEMIDDLGSEL